jgi:hypothetical protein
VGGVYDQHSESSERVPLKGVTWSRIPEPLSTHKIAMPIV